MSARPDPREIADHTARQRLRHVRRCGCGAWVWVTHAADQTPPCPHVPAPEEAAA